MTEYLNYFEVFTNILLLLALGWYLITNLQWYNYKIERVVLKHHKQQWHIIYFATPIVLFYLLPFEYFAIYFYLLYVTSLYLWNKNLSASVVLTGRVKRFLTILLAFAFIVDGLLFLSVDSNYGVAIVLILTYAVTTVLEKIFFLSFKHKAKKRLEKINNLVTVAGLKIRESTETALYGV